MSGARSAEGQNFEQLSLPIHLEPAGSDASSWPQPPQDSPLAQHSFSGRVQDVSPAPQSSSYASAPEIDLSALSTPDLLGILMSRGTQNSSTTDMAEQLLAVLTADDADLYRGLREATLETFMQVVGVGPVRAAAILAAIELGKRVCLPEPQKLTVVDDSSVAVAALSQDLMWERQERFAVVFLDGKSRLLGTHVVTIGTATETLAYPRDVFRVAMERGAKRIIVAHNHPSGSVEPSPNDLSLTETFLECGALLGIPVVDHLILGGGLYCSLREQTSLWQDYPQE